MGSERSIRFGVFEVDLQTGELRKHGIRIKLRDQPFQILSLLLQHPSQVVTREELQRKLWPTDTFVDFGHGLNRAVNQLRDALGDSADNPRFIETFPKRGYRFIAPVEGANDAEVPAATAPPAAPRPEPGPARTAGSNLRARIWLPAAVALMLIALAAAWFYSRTAHAPTEPNTVVLAEFDNHTGDPAFDYALKQALKIDLQQSPFLKILSDQQIADTLRQMGRRPDEGLTQQVARELCVRAGGKAVLGGSVARLGNEYVLNLDALNCLTGEVLGGFPGAGWPATKPRRGIARCCFGPRRAWRPYPNYTLARSAFSG
jgi:DNA-binding winged helix-turn-helix (wHTH) protein